MSVLNQSGEEQVECPLCMEPLEVDDLNFFPCTCGYQICRFCWHRIRLDENGGLCPACRKAYSENPADFIPLSREQVAKLKAEKRQRDQQRKAKLTESRKHLASVRVVQRNLVFVVGLPPRLADPEILKRHEYFGKFGKIHKVVINQSTAYAGAQGPSASAYVTYLKSDDALRAIQAVNNVTIDNRVIKSSLGTTKYCSHFMKNQACPKPDCMYLHEYGDPEASFTREQMHVGKHQEYEKKLHDDLLARSKTQSQGGPGSDSKGTTVVQKGGTKEGSVAATNGQTKDANGSSNKENWPQLDKEKKLEKDKGRKGKTKNCTEVRSKEKKDGKSSSSSDSRSSQDSRTTSTSSNGSQHLCSKIDAKDSDTYPSPELSSEPSPSSSPPSTQSPPLNRSSTPSESSIAPSDFNTPSSDSFSITSNNNNHNGNGVSFTSKLTNGLINSGRSSDEDNSYFSSSGFSKLHNALDNRVTESDGRDKNGVLEIGQAKPLSESSLHDHDPHQLLTDTLPNINTTEDWAAAFGFAGQQAKEQELLQQKLQQQQRESSKLKTAKLPNFMPLERHESGFGKGVDSFNGFFEMSKFQENLMDALATKTNGYNVRPSAQEPPALQSQAHLSNGLDHNIMTKFFSDFHKYNTKEPPSPSPFQNGGGFNGLHNPYQLMMQQNHLEDQYRNLGMKTNSFGGAQPTVYQNGLQYTNGDSALLNGGGGIGSLHSVYSKPPGVTPQAPSRNSEAELDFDPFQETQKALAEMMATEQNHKPTGFMSGRAGHMNGMVHNQNGAHIPPPPPGFMQQQQQQQTHMNSFGSKFLPFLSLSNSQPQQQINSPSNNWPSSFNSSQMAQKNMSNSCNDWKTMDPAILSSSRSYQLPTQHPYGGAVPQPSLGGQQITQNGHVRPFDFPPPSSAAPPNSNNPFSTFTQQLQQQNFGSYTHLNAAPQNVNNLNWFTANDIGSQISSPPGFRNNQTSKQQQEC